jgi:hypothetical protein
MKPKEGCGQHMPGIHTLEIAIFNKPDFQHQFRFEKNYKL